MVQWQGKARHGQWLSLLAREGTSGGRAHVERRDPPGRPATGATAPLPHSRVDTSVTLFPASHPCLTPPLMNLKLICFCDAELMRPLSSISVNVDSSRLPRLAGLKLAADGWQVGQPPALQDKEAVAGWADGTTSCVTPRSFDCDCVTTTTGETFLASLVDTGPLASGHSDMQPQAHTGRKEIRGQTTTTHGTRLGRPTAV